MRKRFVWPSIAVRYLGGLSEEGKSAQITQTRELLQSSSRPLHCLGGSEGEARFGCFVCPWTASHEARFVCFVSSHTKQSHAPSVPEWAQGVSERRSRFSRLHHARTAGIAARVAGHEARLVSFVSGHTKHTGRSTWKPRGVSMRETWRFTHNGGGQHCPPPAFLLTKLEGEPTPPCEPLGPSTMRAAAVPHIPACDPGAPRLLPTEHTLA